MNSSAHVFFAGVGTTFVILAIGFGGGLMLAKTAVQTFLQPEPALKRLLPFVSSFRH
jgi:hypothetical protein